MQTIEIQQDIYGRVVVRKLILAAGLWEIAGPMKIARAMEFGLAACVLRAYG
jgi:hypothetical protein